ncbi:MAG: DUF1684 domain-containing protein [Ignavibacteria bacterium]|nr:DUF1684 domain-containing protein [Ignavibacteria bacterium]
MKYLLLILTCVGFPVFFAACTNDEHAEEELEEFNATTIQIARKEKDAFIKSDPKSPLIPEQQKVFKGLKYFPPTEAFFVDAAFDQAEEPDTIIMLTSKSNDKRRYLRYGFLTFTLGDSTYKLTAFKPLGQATTALFVPFGDATNGRSTYGAGRYIDLEEESGADEYLLDFNAAYNPYCAYNYSYSCPLVPAENILKVSIKAGEKKFGEE